MMVVEGRKSVIVVRQRQVPVSLIEKECLARIKRIKKFLIYRARAS